MSARHRIQRFEVLEQLGSGGMGQVYRARDPQLERDVAIKMLAVAMAPGELSPHDTIDLRTDAPASRDDLLREARMMARLSHPHVLPVYEVGLCDDAVFLVMEHIDGTDLAVWLEAPRTTRAILDVFLQAARGLAAAHQQGIVHRDVKPQNILIGRDGRVRVADFGLSRLAVRSANAMVHLDDGRGTPRYMAPELWRGEPATPHSDVFALCLALVEALGAEPPQSRERTLRERGVRPRLRQLLERGLAEDPAARPTLGQLIAGLEDQPPRWRAWALALSGTGAIAAAIVLGATPTATPAGAPVSAPTCELDPARLAARWDAGRLDAAARMLVEQAQPGFRGVAERIAGDIAAQQRDLDQRLVAACASARDGAITGDEYRNRASCLQRRVFELTASVDLLLETRPNLLEASDTMGTAMAPSYCIGMIAPPIAGDDAAAQALWRRFIRSGIYAVPTRAAEHIAELTAIAEAAAEIGEIELVARSQRWLGIEYRFTGQLTLADEAIQRAYRIALDLKATALAAVLLSDRASVAAARDDGTAARNFAELARDLADNPATPPRVHARIYMKLAEALSAQGDHKAAIGRLRQALEIVKTSGIAAGGLELEIREALISALTRFDVQEPGTIDLAMQTAELARGMVGEHHVEYAGAVYMVAGAFTAVDDFANAILYRRKAIAVWSEVLPADHRIIPESRAWLASNLYNAGDLKAAQREIAEVVRLTASNSNYPQNKWLNEAFFATVAFELGQLEPGLARAMHAHEEAISMYGKQHPDTLDVRRDIAAMELELHRLDAAERDIAAVEEACRAKPEGNQLRLLRLQGTLAAELASARGKPADAEAAARRAIAAAGELHATDRDRASFHSTLGASLVAQHRWAEAVTALDAALALLTKARGRPDDIAAVEINLAVAEAGLGKRGPALARARGARAVLDDYPGRLRARKQADDLLGSPRARRL